MSGLRKLWCGEIPLDKAFWGYAVVGGLAVNLVTSLLFLAFASAHWTVAALAAGYGLSVPYNLVVTVGVWRAAGREEGNRPKAELLRLLTLVGMTLLTVT